ncbi:MAG: DUF465 domain-containing protein [Gammaproteobacteria bacterium]|nr:DUF465 domain-containing protein [Gammaproteobacteria bacterium]
MFEFDQDAVSVLRVEDANFSRLFDKHAALKSRIHEASCWTNPLDDVALETLKKLKLQAKDQMAKIIRHYRQVHPQA